MSPRHSEVPPHPRLRDPLEAVPRRPDDVELRTDSRGRVHLRRRERLPPMRRKLAEWLGFDYSRKVELDDVGTAYFRLVDGRRSLRAIVEALTGLTHRSAREVEAAVMLFTKKLMVMGFIELEVAGPPRKDSANE